MQETFNNITTIEKRKSLRKTSTEAEKILWEYLRNRRFQNVKFYRQYGIGFYIADFYCPSLKLVIELDGSKHFSEDSLDYDKIREEYMKALNIATLGVNNFEVLSNIENVLKEIQIIINDKINN